MQHSFASQESFGSPDEDPQPAEPSPVHRALRAHLAGEGVEPQSSSPYRLEHEERLRPSDLLEELSDYDLELLPGIFMHGVGHSLLDLDTYTGISLEASTDKWQLRLENIDGYSRTISYDDKSPLNITLHDECPERSRLAEYPLAIDKQIAAHLQDEVVSFVGWLQAQCPDAKLRQQQAARLDAFNRRQEVSQLSPARARRFGRLSLRFWRG